MLAEIEKLMDRASVAHGGRHALDLMVRLIQDYEESTSACDPSPVRCCISHGEAGCGRSIWSHYQVQSYVSES